jgi:thiol:disulfide interchange protein DsbD
MIKNLRSLTVLVLLLGLPYFAQAQMMSSADKVDIQTAISVDRVEQGSEFKAVVFLNLQYPWHVNSNTPTLDWLIPTELTVNLPNDVILSDIRYPPAITQKFGFAEEPLDVFEGATPIYISLRTSSSMAPGDYVIEGRLRIQACDDMQCLAPANVDVRIPYTVVAAGTGSNLVNQDLFEGYELSVTAGSGGFANEISDLFEGHFALALIGIFLIGLALNLTPCVYPMISVTVSLFGQKNESSTWKVFFQAVVYVLGIAAMYSALGVIAALTGGLFGSWLQSPWMLGFIGFLMFGLALSMFGLYEIQVPYWLTSKLGSGNTTGTIGTFISGLVVGIFAAPCVGPPIIALLAYVGTVGDVLFGFWVFFVLSLGLGFPYLILGTFSGLMQKMPKSGVWMVWVKKLFGIVLIGIGGFYFGLALFPQFVEWIIIFTLILGGIYLGFLERSGSDRRGFRFTKLVTGVVAIVLGIMFYMNLQKEGVQWEMYSAEKLEAASLNSQPVMIDFYADWCIPCLELDRITFTDEEVIRQTKNMMRLKVDLTNFDSPESEALRQQYNIAGVPTIVFLDENGDEVHQARIVGFMRPNEFLRRVHMATGEELSSLK